MTSTPNAPTFVFDDLPLHWQMTRWEKFAFANVVEVAQPEVAKSQRGLYETLLPRSRHATPGLGSRILRRFLAGIGRG